MSTGFWLRSLAEIAFVVLLITALLREDKIVDWEDRVFTKVSSGIRAFFRGKRRHKRSVKKQMVCYSPALCPIPSEQSPPHKMCG